jgi:hypothetical protein
MFGGAAILPVWFCGLELPNAIDALRRSGFPRDKNEKIWRAEENFRHELRLAPQHLINA